MNPAVKISWHPGCSYNGAFYYVGDVGQEGPSVDNPIKVDQLDLQSVLPKAINCTIEVPYNLYDNIVTVLTSLKGSGDVIELDFKKPNNKVDFTKFNFEIRHESLEELTDILIENMAIKKRFDKLLQDAKDLDVQITVNTFPKYAPIPGKFLTCDTLTNVQTSGFINVRAHRHTKFYQCLHNNGLLIKNFPQWYKELLCKQRSA